MPEHRESMLDTIEEALGSRHPDFDSIRAEFKRIAENVDDEGIKDDTDLLIAGVTTMKNTYDDWDDMSEFERERSLEALSRVKGLIVSILQKYDISVRE